MLTALSFQNFRGFTAFDARFKPVTVLVGANSSGKTSVLHATRMVIEALDLGLERGTPHAEASGRISVCKNLIVDDFARLVPVDDWVELFKGGEVSEGSSLRIEASFDGELSKLVVSIEYARNRQPKLGVDAWCRAATAAVAAIPKKSSRRPDLLASTLRAHSPRALLVPAFYGVTRGEEHRSEALIQRLLSGGDQSRVVRNLVARLTTARFEALNSFLRRTVRAQLTRRTSGDEIDRALHLKVYFTDENGELELSSAGAGLVNLVALYASMAHLRETQGDRTLIYLLDEPEAHLHPKLQGDVGDTIAALAREFDAQVIMATHAVEIVNRIGERPDAVLLAVNRRATPSATPLDSEAQVVRELAQWCDLTPFTSLNFLASRRVLFHEGPTDAAILTACARVYFRDRPVELQNFRRWTMISLDGVGNASAQAILGAVVSPALFPDLNEKRTVRAVCVFDRDAERKPGGARIAALSKNHFEAYTHVWSRYSIESLFLDVECLFAWLRAWLPADVADTVLRAAIVEGIAAADKDTTLDDEASDAIERVKLREGLKLAYAKKFARAEARREPWVWQKGRTRAHVVFGRVRVKLAKNRQNKVRSSVADLVELPTEMLLLGDIDRLVPREVRELLDWLVDKH